MGCVQCINANDKDMNDSLNESRNDTILVIKDFYNQQSPESKYNKNKFKLCKEDFKFLNLIGKGAFGEVYLAEKIINNKLYAIKVLQKQNIKENNQVLHTQAERQILENMNNHPYIIQLHCAFQSHKKLYMVMDFMQGGELFFHIRQANQFSEIRAMFYAAQIVLALEHLHKNQIIYRDLKPENILMDSKGHIKLADFGLSKLGINENIKTYTICGTPEYLAPEIFLNQGHDKTADWWSLGALLYEMLTGAPPFYSRNKEKMLQSILQKPIEMKEYFSKEAKLILQQLLQIDPQKRLGHENDAEDLKSHVFFRYFDWQKLIKKKYDAPFKPKLNGPLDLRYIDKMFKYEPLKNTYNDKDQMFLGEHDNQSVSQNQANYNQGFEGFSMARHSNRMSDYSINPN